LLLGEEILLLGGGCAPASGREFDMPVRPIFDPAHLYFVTTTAVDRACIFQRDAIKRILVDSLAFLRADGQIELCIFVIMPNHVHLIMRALGKQTVASVIRDFKRHTARQIVRQYQAEGNQRALDFLERAASSEPKQQSKVWEEGYDARNVFTPEFLRQKSKYIHENPCQPHWALAERPETYAWSSARYYMLGEPVIIAVDDVSAWLA
jgi:REP element-mobilizing transposase RayT